MERTSTDAARIDTILELVAQLPRELQLEVADRIQHPEEPELTDAMKRFLRARVAAHKANPEAAMPAYESLARLKKRHGVDP